MKVFYRQPQRIYFILILIIFSFFTGCNKGTSAEDETKNLALSHPDPMQSDEIAVSPPPFNDEYIFPCSECHSEMEVNSQPRVLEMHEEIVESFTHDNENRWCLDCHDANTRDSLRLASGKLLGFNESYKLCGQCHGDKLRDWKVGVHGKRTGEWNGRKQYLLCVHCHDPHSPAFPRLHPEPPPIKQEDLRKVNK